jgi:ferredoxin--NADP+ reductase
MSSLATERVLSVHHWTDTLFSFTTTRDPSFRFQSGQFTMIGLPVNGKPLLRAYSMASANYDETLEFFSIKVPDGPLTSRLQHLQEGETILVGRKPVGTLLLDDLLPGKVLYLLGTGTGLAPFLSLIRDPETYERFEKVVLTHTCRVSAELAYTRPHHPRTAGERTDRRHGAREAALLSDGDARAVPQHRTHHSCDRLRSALRRHWPAGARSGHDRVMICGSQAMNKDCCDLLDARGFKMSPRIGVAGDYVIERAFVEK